MKHIFLFPAFLGPLTGSAQITPLGTLNGQMELVNTLASGLKYLTFDSAGFTLYHIDLTLDQVVLYPPFTGFVLPFGYDAPDYISEDLFELDPTTLEFALRGYGSGPPFDMADARTIIVRTDGTILFNEAGWLWGNSQDPPGVHNTSAGTRMALLTQSESHVYLLPGQLPCAACDGSISVGMIPPGHEAVYTGGSSIFPNPVSEMAHVVFDLPEGEHPRQLIMFNAAGQEVKRLPIPNGAHELTILTHDLVSGMYSYSLEVDDHIVPGKRMIVIR